MNNPQSRSRILLTGATGFIGRRLQKALELRGHDVVTISRRAPDDLTKVLNIDLSHQEVHAEQLKTIETVIISQAMPTTSLTRAKSPIVIAL